MPLTSGLTQIVGLACYAFLLYSPSSTASFPADWNFPLPAVDQAVLANFPHENEDHRDTCCSIEQIKVNPSSIHKREKLFWSDTSRNTKT